jgi:hypothetical protein
MSAIIAVGSPAARASAPVAAGVEHLSHPRIKYLSLVLEGDLERGDEPRDLVGRHARMLARQPEEHPPNGVHGEPEADAEAIKM